MDFRVPLVLTGIVYVVADPFILSIISSLFKFFGFPCSFVCIFFCFVNLFLFCGPVLVSVCLFCFNNHSRISFLHSSLSVAVGVSLFFCSCPFICSFSICLGMHLTSHRQSSLKCPLMLQLHLLFLAGHWHLIISVVSWLLLPQFRHHLFLLISFGVLPSQWH